MDVLLFMETKKCTFCVPPTSNRSISASRKPGISVLTELHSFACGECPSQHAETWSGLMATLVKFTRLKPFSYCTHFEWSIKTPCQAMRCMHLSLKWPGVYSIQTKLTIARKYGHCRSRLCRIKKIGTLGHAWSKLRCSWPRVNSNTANQHSMRDGELSLSQPMTALHWEAPSTEYYTVYSKPLVTSRPNQALYAIQFQWPRLRGRQRNSHILN